MDRKKLLFIYNPKAGKEQIRMRLSDILNTFAKNGYEITVYPTQYAGDAIEAAEKMQERYDLVVCSGGDGTLDEVVTGIMHCENRTTIGYIPAGSTNDFANSLHIPKSMVKAANVAVNGKEFLCDVGAFNKDFFVYIAAFGLFTDVSYETNQQMKNILGHMAYLLEGMKRLPVTKAFHFKVTYDGNAIEDDFIFGMVTNSVSVGGFKRITGKYVELDDGVFEVTLIKIPKNPVELNTIMAALLVGDIDTELMYCFKTKKVIFESDEKIPWTLDGEFGGEQKKVTIKNRKQAIRIMIPTEMKKD